MIGKAQLWALLVLAGRFNVTDGNKSIYILSTGWRIECKPVSLELTYGLERLAMFVQKVDNIFDIKWDGSGITYGDIFKKNEEQCLLTILYMPKKIFYLIHFLFDKGCENLIENNLPLPAYELCIKASHAFNLLDARGLISVTERQAYILKIRSLVQKCCNLILENNE